MLLKATRIPKTHFSQGETGISNLYASKRTKLASVLRKAQPNPPLYANPQTPQNG